VNVHVTLVGAMTIALNRFSVPKTVQDTVHAMFCPLLLSKANFFTDALPDLNLPTHSSRSMPMKILKALL
jgi:hypothetical protein